MELQHGGARAAARRSALPWRGHRRIGAALPSFLEMMNGPASQGCRGGSITSSSDLSPDTKETKMPKLKTKSGVKKRFKLTASGLVKHGVAGKRHRLISHNAKYIRQNRGTEVLADADTARVKLWAPYGLK
jgi:large subunit ribosomal protein L35